MTYRLPVLLVFLLFSRIISGQDMAPAFDDRGFYGYKDSAGTFIIPAEFNYAWPFSEGFARILLDNRVYKDDSISFINSKGEEAFERRFLQAYDFHEGFAAVNTGSSWNFINREGKFIDPAGFEEVRSFGKGYARVKREGLWGLINKEGEFLIPCRYGFIGFPEQKKKEENLKEVCLRAPFKYGFEYYELLKPVYGAVPVFKDSLWGFASLKGKEIISPVFTEIKPFNGKIARVKTKEGWVFINKKYKVVSEDTYLETGEFREKLAAVRKKDPSGKSPEGAWGFVNSKGKTIIPFEYDRVFFPFMHGFAVTGKSNGRRILAGVITRKNKVLIPFRYEEIHEKTNGIFLVKDSLEKWGFCDDKGREIVKPHYGALVPLRNKTIVAEESGSWGLLDYHGKTFIPFNYKKIRFSDKSTVEAHEFPLWEIFNLSSDANREKLFSLHADTVTSVYCLVNTKDSSHTATLSAFVIRNGQNTQISHEVSELFGSTIPGTNNTDLCIGMPVPDEEKYSLEQKFGSVETAEKGKLYIVKVNQKYGITDSSGKFIFPADFSHISYSPEDSIFTVRSGKQYGLAEENGVYTMSLNNQYDTLYSFSEGLAVVRKEGQFGYINRNGKLRISLQYEGAGEFSEGYAAIKLLGKWGFINKDEKITAQPRFDEAMPFSNGIALVKKDGKVNFIDTNGKIANTSWYDSASRNEHGNWEIRIRYKKGLAGADGKELLSPKYDYLEDFGNGMVKVGKDGKFGLLDYKENFIILVSYNNVIYYPEQNLILTKTERDTETIHLPEHEK